MTPTDPEMSALLDAVCRNGEDPTPAKIMADLIIERCGEANLLVGYVPYQDAQDEGVTMSALFRDNAYQLQFIESDLRLAFTETFTAQELVDKLPTWLDRQFEFLYHIMSK